MPRAYLRRENPEGYITVAEISALTGLHPNTIYRTWIDRELLPVTRGVRGEYLARRKDAARVFRKYYRRELD